MRIDCTDDILSAGDKKRQDSILAEFSGNVIYRTTDISIPFYKLDIKKFEKIWPPHDLNSNECGFWQEILRSDNNRNYRREKKNIDFLDYDINDPCSGKLSAKTSIAFLDDVQYAKLNKFDFIESPGIYIKNPLSVNEYLFDFMVSYNMHRSEIYYLSNRKAVSDKFTTQEMEYFKRFIVSFLTIKSLFKRNKNIVKELVLYHATSLVGSWRVPFIILNRVPESKWKSILENEEIVLATEDLLSGVPIENVYFRFERIYRELLP